MANLVDRYMENNRTTELIINALKRRCTINKGEMLQLLMYMTSVNRKYKIKEFSFAGSSSTNRDLLEALNYMNLYTDEEIINFVSFKRCLVRDKNMLNLKGVLIDL